MAEAAAVRRIGRRAVPAAVHSEGHPSAAGFGDTLGARRYSVATMMELPATTAALDPVPARRRAARLFTTAGARLGS